MNQEERDRFAALLGDCDPADHFAKASDGEPDFYGLPNLPRVQWRPRDEDDDVPVATPRAEAVRPIIPTTPLPLPVTPEPPIIVEPCYCPPPPEHHHRMCAVDLPYPPARAEGRAPASIRAVQSAYAGCASEVSAVMQYLYDALVLAACQPEAAETLRCIAICEMKHVWLLGELLTSMGCDPKFRAPCETGNGWWNAGPGYLRYPNRLESAILEAIAAERQAIEGYVRMLKTLDDEGICLLVRRIILDEEHHIKLLTSLHERFCR